MRRAEEWCEWPWFTGRAFALIAGALIAVFLVTLVLAGRDSLWWLAACSPVGVLLSLTFAAFYARSQVRRG